MRKFVKNVFPSRQEWLRNKKSTIIGCFALDNMWNIQLSLNHTGFQFYVSNPNDNVSYVHSITV